MSQPYYTTPIFTLSIIFIKAVVLIFHRPPPVIPTERKRVERIFLPSFWSVSDRISNRLYHFAVAHSRVTYPRLVIPTKWAKPTHGAYLKIHSQNPPTYTVERKLKNARKDVRLVSGNLPHQNTALQSKGWAKGRAQPKRICTRNYRV